MAERHFLLLNQRSCVFLHDEINECIITGAEGGFEGGCLMGVFEGGVPCCLGSAVFGRLCLCSNLIKCEKRGQA